MSLIYSVTITPAGGGATTLCDGVGYRDSTHWAYLDLQLPAEYAGQVQSAIRASFTKPLTRITVSPKLTLRVEKVYATPEAAIVAKLLLPASAIPSGTIVIVVFSGAGGTITISDAAIESCRPVTNGCTLTVDWVYKCGAVVGS